MVKKLNATRLGAALMLLFCLILVVFIAAMTMRNKFPDAEIRADAGKQIEPAAPQPTPGDEQQGDEEIDEAEEDIPAVDYRTLAAILKQRAANPDTAPGAAKFQVKVGGRTLQFDTKPNPAPRDTAMPPGESPVVKLTRAKGRRLTFDDKTMVRVNEQIKAEVDDGLRRGLLEQLKRYRSVKPAKSTNKAGQKAVAPAELPSHFNIEKNYREQELRKLEEQLAKES